jgi:hypothetical protein
MLKSTEISPANLSTEMGESRAQISHAPPKAYKNDAADQICLPRHLLSMPGAQWAIWRLTGLRGAGFAADQVLQLAAPVCAAAADSLIDAEQESRAATDGVRAVLEQELDALRLAGQWNDRNKRGLLLDALTDLKINRVPKLLPDLPAAAKAFSAHDDARKKVDLLFSEYSRSFQIAASDLTQTIHEVASCERFQEAVIWQNRHAWRSGIRLLLRDADALRQRTSKQRQQEELVASYLQRYCVKNDTIGFFGPVGWAHLVSEGNPIRIRPGPDLLATRSLYFEGWCIDELAAAISKDKSLRVWLAPRCAPFLRLEKGTMYLPGGTPLKLRPEEAVVLEACDGKRPANLIAAELLRANLLPHQNEAEIYRILETFCTRGMLIWGFDIPLQRRAEVALRDLLLKTGLCSGRESGLRALDELESARSRIAAARGSVENLDRELTALEEKFTSLTRAASTRRAGQTYAARTLIYEDCRRDIEVSLGREVLEALAPPLSLLLASVRWLSAEVASTYREAFRSIYTALVVKTQSKTISAADFWVKCDPIFYKDGTRIADRILPIFQARWMEVLSFPADARRVNFSTEELRPRIEAAFAAACPGWSHARYNSPDVMIAASGVEAFRRGHFQLVIGEVHLGVNCLNGALFVGQHPRPEEIHDAITADFQQPCLVPVPPKSWPTLTARTSFEFVSPSNYRLLVSADTGNVKSQRALTISELVVEECEEQLLLKTRDNAVEFEIVEGFGEFLSNLIMNFFVILPPLPHTPRITIDRVTIARESWRFSPDELGFAFDSNEALRFLSARRWAREFDLPRFAFIKSPVEKKPFYVDFQSPILVNLFAKIIRRTRDSTCSSPLITVTEMLPSHGQFWLPDAEGHHYTSELRMVTLDMAEGQHPFKEVE